MTAARSYNSLSLPHRVRPEARGIWHQHTSGSLATIIYEQQQPPPPPDNHSVSVGGAAKSRMNNSHQLCAGKLSDSISFPSVHTQTPCLKSLSQNSHTQTVDARVDRTCQTQQYEHNNNNNNNNNNNYSFHSSNITPSSNIVSSSLWSDKSVIKQQHDNSQYSFDSGVNSTRPVYDAGGDNSQVLLTADTHTDNNKSPVSHQTNGDLLDTVTDGVKSPVDRVFSGDSGVYNCLPLSVSSHYKQYKNGAISTNNNNNKIESDVICKDPMKEQITDSTDKTVCDRKLRERRVQDLINQLNQQRSLYQQARNRKLSTNKNSRSQNAPVKLVARRTEYHNNNNNTYNNRQTRSGNISKITAEQYDTQDDVVRDSRHNRHDMIALNNNTTAAMSRAANKTTGTGTSTGTTAQYHSHPTVNCDINNNRKKASSSAVTVNFVRLNRQMAGNNQRHLDVRSRSLPRSQQQQQQQHNSSNNRGDVVKTSHVPTVLPHLQHHATSRAATLPAYLVRRKRKLLAEKLSRQQENVAKSCQNLVQCPAGYHLMQESQRLQTLQQLTQNQQKLIAELHKLPISCSISGASGQRRLQTLQQHLHQIDAGIQVFSRSRVYVRDDHSQTH